MAEISAPQKEVDFTQGFGSFNFAPPLFTSSDLIFRKPDKKIYIQEQPFASGPLPEQFPFKQLPPEIRRRIYKCFASELCNDENDGLDARYPNTGIRFFVTDRPFDSDKPEKDASFSIVVAGAPDQRNIDPRPGANEGRPINLLEMYKAIQTGEFEEDDPNLPPAWQNIRNSDANEPSSEEEAESSGVEGSESDWDSDEAEVAVNLRHGNIATSTQTNQLPTASQPRCAVMIKDRAQDNPHCLVHHYHWRGHPEKEGDRCYCDSIPPTHNSARRMAKCLCSYRPPSSYDHIRRLSQVSKQIAAELGECLWANAMVEFDGPEIFFTFAAERPAALRLIKGIVLRVDCIAGALDTTPVHLGGVLEFVSARMDVLSFGVRLYTFLDALRVKADADGAAPPWKKMAGWAPLFRALRTRAFTVRVTGLSEALPGVPARSNVRVDSELGGLIERAERSALDLWKPDCIREREEGEQVRYLRSRELA
ncbi:hypothetical protein B0T25DRAFT_231346 [Lasiosphaeria hispida]|uniref:Uncharacterized protein n=1 Tax=Lasiosphaeria hispida TaxID=260671 RepID=A0AAJ0MBX2_9PEZI|nr:hypothetical protein B0T25DRAFT_231346 [Lasiosphaeria hispida]